MIIVIDILQIYLKELAKLYNCLGCYQLVERWKMENLWKQE